MNGRGPLDDAELRELLLAATLEKPLDPVMVERALRAEDGDDEF